jgi:hypothetical protein
MRATTLAAARRGEMEVAISRGVVPCGTSFTAPSGRWMEIVCVLIVVSGVTQQDIPVPERTLLDGH